jgi:16S rRNA processing protein RimM
VTAPELVIVGRLRKAHGVRGDILVEPITDEPAEVFSVGRRLFAGTTDAQDAPDAPALTIVAAREHGGSLLRVHFTDIDSRTDAERLTNRFLFAPASELRAPGEDEIYLQDLVGMTVQDATLGEIGEVIAFFELPQNLLLEVRRAGGTVLVPYRAEFLEGVDRDAKRIRMRLPDGIVD